MSRLSATAAHRRPATGRRGTILIVVLALLAIFAVIGIAFVFYSDGEALAARYHRESQTNSGQMIPSPPNQFNTHADTVFASLVFGNYNNELDSFRGHDLMSTIYGGQGTTTDPFTGQGIFHEPPDPTTPTNPLNTAIKSRGHIVNNTPVNIGGTYFVFDPEMAGGMRNLTKGDTLPTGTSPGSGKTYISKAAPYTYPDLNNFYLASISPGTGETILPSFYRPWHFNSTPVQLPGFAAPTPTPINRRLEPWNPTDPVLVANTDWVTPEGRWKTLRPRPIDQLTATDFAQGIPSLGIPPLPFPIASQLSNYSAVQVNFLFQFIDANIRNGTIIGYPRPNDDGLTTGDVFNIIGGVGFQRNDSILIDFGAQPIRWPQNSNASAQNWVKPLAAVTITDMDGLLNLNAHGNVRNGGNHISFHGLGPWEVNLAGALGNVTEGNTIVSSRYGTAGNAGSRNGTTTLAFSPAGRMGAYALVAWDGTGTAGPLQLPTFVASPPPPSSAFTVTATYGGTNFYDDNTSTTQQNNHPALYNPSEWTAFPEGKLLNPFPTSGGPRFTYPVTDTRRLRQRYAGELELYQQTTLARLGSTPTNSLVSLVGNQASFPPGTSTYRNDPAHGRRLMTTTLSADLDRPRLMTSATGDTKNSFALAASGPGIHPTNTGLQSSLSGVSPTPALSALDVNRPLADYRSDTSKSLSPTNVTTASANQAWADRHNLARDIFGRLILATAGTTSFDTKTGLLSVGASSNITATINPTTGDVTVKAASGSSELNGLRYLAQLAVNMVDYVDNDDVSTVFVWQPSGGGALTVVDATSVVNNANTALPANTQPNGDNVVFGFEVPRLVINETYAEITNDPADANLGANKTPPNPGQVRFWVELLNPAGNATKQSMYLGGSDGPLASPDGKLADGSVTLYVAAAHRPYRLQIAKGGTENAQLYQTPNNSAGELSATAAGTSPLVDFRFDSTDIVNNAAKQTVAPNNGSYTGATGIVVVGPSVQTFNGIEMKSDPSAAPWNGQTYLQSNPITAPIGSNAMGYQYATPVAAPAAPTASLPASNTLETYAANLGRHVVLLRRLANPYQPEAANNPYVTVDMMDYVPAHDAVHRASDNMTDRSARATPGTGTGYDTLTDRFAVGKVQPYAGLAADGTAAGGGKQATPAGFPTSFVIPQVANSNTSLPKCSLFRHNGKNDTGPTANTASGATPPTLNNGETLLAPFDWFFHPDRPLINELEFLGVQAVKPHEVTQYTFQPPLSGGPQIRRYNGLAPWLGVTTTGGAAQAQGFPTFDPPSGYPAFQSATATPALNVTGNGLYRAFELLRGKSRVFGTATGGRVQGKININTLQDSRVLIALLDAQPKNAFAGAEVFNSGNPADTTTIWGRFIASRTQGLSTRTLDDGTTQVFTTTPGKTIDDDPYDTAWQKLDRPFKSFGVAEAAQTKNNAGTIVGGGNVVATDTSSNPTPFGPGLQDTLLRVDPATRRPLAYTTGAAATHPYLQAEALRKLLNNTTTVSNVFCIHVTIVYHNVRLDPATPGSPLAEGVPGLNQTGVQRFFLGSEAFRDVPGDMRQQYLAIVDRSNAAIDVKNTTDANTVVPNSPTACQPFQAATSAGFTMTSGTGKFSLAGSTLNTGNGTIVVWHDGQAFTIPGSGSNGTNTLYVGSGQDRVQVTVTVNATTGELTATETNSGTTTRTFPAGALVSAGVSGRPTRPTGFSPTTPNHPFQLLVPYCGLVRAVASIK